MLLLALFQLMASCQSGTVSVSTHDNFALTNAPTYEGSGFLDCSITLSNPKVVVWAIMYFGHFLMHLPLRLAVTVIIQPP